MSDTDKELVARLRGEYRIPITDGHGPAGGDEADNAREFVRHFPSTPIQREAADAIERLSGEVEFVKGQLAGTNKNIAGWLEARDDNLKRAMKAEVEWLRKAADLVHANHENELNRAEAAEAEVERLKQEIASLETQLVEASFWEDV